MKRVVITGYGLVSPIGNSQEEFLTSLKTGKNGINELTKFDSSELGIKLAGQVKYFPLDKYFNKKDTKRMDMFSIYGIHASLDAIEMADINMEEIDADRFGVIVGSGIGGVSTTESQIIKMDTKGPNRVSPMFIPMTIANMAAGNIALRVGAKGVCTSVVTACASGSHSIGEAYRNIKHGYSDVILAGGTEASICESIVAGFNSLTALTRESNPSKGSRPFDENRNGFVMGEGSGILVLESLEHAQKRGANILGEIVGYGATCDSYHMTAPNPDGSGAGKAIKLALEEAGIEASKLDYINAHGTSTQANDSGEAKAIHYALGEYGSKVPVSSTKSMTGHLLGAAGGIEAIATLLAIKENFLPPSINIEKQDPEIDLNIVKNQAQETEVKYALSNSLGFGGHNAVILMKEWEK